MDQIVKQIFPCLWKCLNFTRSSRVEAAFSDSVHNVKKSLGRKKKQKLKQLKFHFEMRPSFFHDVIIISDRGL